MTRQPAYDYRSQNTGNIGFKSDRAAQPTKAGMVQVRAKANNVSSSTPSILHFAFK